MRQRRLIFCYSVYFQLDMLIQACSVSMVTAVHHDPSESVPRREGSRGLARFFAMRWKNRRTCILLQDAVGKRPGDAIAAPPYPVHRSHRYTPIDTWRGGHGEAHFGPVSPPVVGLSR